MVAFPYPKLCTANIQVDQGPASSAAPSRRPVRPASRRRWVFPLAGAEANDHWFLSVTALAASLARDPARRRGGAQLAGVGVDDVASLDLYSASPCGADGCGRARPRPSRTRGR